MHEVRALFEKSIVVVASPETVFEILSDIPDSVAHFPGLEELTPAGDGYRWVLEKHGPSKYAVKMEYAVRYETDADALTVTWSPIEGIGNSRVEGQWTIRRRGDRTVASIRNDLSIFLKIPRIVRRLASPIVSKRNHALLEGYLTNLETTFNGGDGRLRLLK